MLFSLTVLSKSAVTLIKTPTIFNCVSVFKRNYSKLTMSDVPSLVRQLVPPLSNDKHKGQAGRIGIFGGSLEYTGAPYFAAISTLKVGADLVYIFCRKDAATVIKSYSPELIVLPHLDAPNAMDEIEPWLERLHVVLIGPGLGRAPTTFTVIEKVIDACRRKNKPLVIDADGLFFIAQNANVIKDYPARIIMTPNAMEFNRLVGGQNDGTKVDRSKDFLKNLGSNVTLLCKDHEDEIINNGKSVKGSDGGSGRRCGGQGDLMAGALSTFFAWALEAKFETGDFDYRSAVACYAASKLTRTCNERAFCKFGRSMICTNMIEEIHPVFQQHFEIQEIK